MRAKAPGYCLGLSLQIPATPGPDREYFVPTALLRYHLTGNCNREEPEKCASMFPATKRILPTQYSATTAAAPDAQPALTRAGYQLTTTGDADVRTPPAAARFRQIRSPYTARPTAHSWMRSPSGDKQTIRQPPSRPEDTHPRAVCIPTQVRIVRIEATPLYVAAI